MRRYQTNLTLMLSNRVDYRRNQKERGKCIRMNHVPINWQSALPLELCRPEWEIHAFEVSFLAGLQTNLCLDTPSLTELSWKQSDLVSILSKLVWKACMPICWICRVHDAREDLSLIDRTTEGSPILPCREMERWYPFPSSRQQLPRSCLWLSWP